MVQSYKQNEVLFHEGDQSNFVYRLVSGKAEITTRFNGGQEFGGTCHPGDFIGEIGVLVVCRRGGTARFTEDSNVEILTRQEFLTLVAADAKLNIRLMNVLSLRTRSQIDLLQKLPSLDSGERLRWGNIRSYLMSQWDRLVSSLFAWLRRRLKSKLIQKADADIRNHAGHRRVVFRGSYLFREGEDSQHVYWIESGKLRMTQTQDGVECERGTLGHNEFIGAMGVLESLPRSVSAIADTDTKVHVLSASQFYAVMQASPSAYLLVIESLCERVITLRKKILKVRLLTGAALPSDNTMFGLVRSMESISQLAERRWIEESRRVSNIFKDQIEHGKYIADVYQRSVKGTATKDEIEKANAYFRDYLKLAGLGTLFLLPGGVLTISLAIKIGKSIGIDILPELERAHEENKKISF